MKGKVVVGYVHSILNKYGDEMLLMSSFGITKTKSKKYFNFQNQKKLEPVKPLNRYLVHVAVMEKE